MQTLRKLHDAASVTRFVCHSRRVLKIAARFGWLPGARYTNLRDVRRFERIGFIDIQWSEYSFKRHLEAVKATRPIMTVARDIENMEDLELILDQAEELDIHSEYVVVVPKDLRLASVMDGAIPSKFVLGYSVPTRYGGTRIPLHAFKRPVHLLGGRPDVQRKLAESASVVSLDCNRFTIDAAFGDYFDGETFRLHLYGGYERCLRASLGNINKLWRDYTPNGSRTYEHRPTRKTL